MDKSQVIKVKYNGRMCRITAAKVANENVISYAALEDRIRSSFKLSPADVISITYSDVDGDVVNLSSDQDIVDALVYQQLNPLRLELQVEKGPDIAASIASLPTSASVSSQASLVSAASLSSSSTEKLEEAATTPAEEKPALENLSGLLEKQLRSALSSGSEKVLKNLEPLLEKAPAKLAQVLEAALKGGLSVSADGSSTNSRNIPLVHAVNTEVKADLVSKEAVNTGGAVSAVAAAPPCVNGVALLYPVAAAAPKSSPERPATTAKPAVTVAASTSAPAPAAGTAADAATPPVVHRGIICDGCDMNPIMGPRFKSLVKHDYDLCEGCYKKANPGPGEYKCYDTPVFRPVHRQGPPSLNGPHAFRAASWSAPNQAAGRPRCAPPQSAAFGNRSCSVRPFPPDMKLEARFVDDVTIPDAMEMLPGTRFTKTWKMRNTGNIPWPQFSQIVHIGGDFLGERNAVPLQFPEGGVQPDQEVDVSVNMVAPFRIGRYMSHWRLCAPGGPKFGHRVWALIQVVCHEKFATEAPPAFFAPAVKMLSPPIVAPAVAPSTSMADRLPSQEAVAAAAAAPTAEKEAPAPAAEAGAGAPVEAEADVDPIVTAVRSAVPPTLENEEKDAMKDEVKEVAPPEKTEEVRPFTETKEAAAAEGCVEVGDFKIVEPVSAAPVDPSVPPLPSAPSVESTGVGSFSLVDSVPAKVVGSASISDAAAADGYVDAGVALPEESAPNGQAAKAVDLAASARENKVLIEDEEESEALDQLEGMGFEDRELNRQALKAAKGSVVEAIDALMKTAEWDPILSELEEMGFEDKLLNKRMMFKNDGNVKGAVKDIVHFYKNQ